VGPQGPTGNSIIYGSGAPTSSVGNNGDTYIDTTAHFIYGPKAGGAWPAGVSLIGPTGPQGPQGNTGPQGPVGPIGPTGPSITYVSVTPPTGVPDNTLWWESDTGQLYLYYNDGTSRQWVTAVPQPDTSSFVLKTGDTMTGMLSLYADPSTNMQAATKQYVDNRFGVRYDAPQGLTVAQQLQARSNIYAAPFDAEGFHGLQINGTMEFSNYNGTNGVNVSGSGYFLDQWQFGVTTTGGSLAMQQFDYSSSPDGFLNGLLLKANTAPTSVAAGDAVYIQQPIEGHRTWKLMWAKTNPQPITVSFWLATSRSGTACLVIRNGATNRSYCAEFAVTGGNLWQYKTITIPGDAAGTWLGGQTQVGLYMHFCFLCGTTYKIGTNSAWTANNALASAGQTNFFQANGDQVTLTGVTVLPGSMGPSAAYSMNAFRKFEEEDKFVKRYYAGKWCTARFFASGAGQTVETACDWPVTMMKNPSVSLSAGSALTANMAAGYPVIQSPNTVSSRYIIASNASGDCYGILYLALAAAQL
jgi:hypothetical protein